MSGKGTRDLAVWSRAFPSAIGSEVESVVSMLPDKIHPTTGWTIDSVRHPRGLWSGGAPVEIPARQYHEPLQPQLSPANELQASILGCIYSRHHDGYVRQAWLRTLLDFPQPFAAPFIVQLVGEYVIEIVVDIAHGVGVGGGKWAPILASFAHENPGFLSLTADRATSYWDCYYRRLYPRFSDHPGAQVMALLRTLATEAQP